MSSSISRRPAAAVGRRRPQAGRRSRHQHGDHRLDALVQTLCASREVTNFIDRGRGAQARIVEARAGDRMTPDDVANIFRGRTARRWCRCRYSISMKEEAAAPALRRYNRLPSITLMASLRRGALRPGDGDFGLPATPCWPRPSSAGRASRSSSREASANRQPRAGARSFQLAASAPGEFQPSAGDHAVGAVGAGGCRLCPVFHRLEPYLKERSASCC